MRIFVLVVGAGLLLVVPAAAQDAAAGEKVFAQCRACHQIGESAKNAVGPVLNGLFGRKAGSIEGFNYSAANKNSGRAGKLGWDACAHGANGTRFDNGVPLWPGTGNVIGAFAASGSAVLRGAGGCDLTYSYHPTMSAPFAAADGIVYRPDWLYLEMEEKATGRSP